jgi:succinate dehydrogenase/fumarate reductase flavoprotein subunit
MGDYLLHSSETGRALCSSYKDVQASGRADKNDMSRKAAIEQELKKVEFYSLRYINHQNAIKFGEKKLEVIKTQIDVVCSSQSRYSYNDFRFLIEMANLVVAARRTISFTYAIRFYLVGRNKQ